jgi:lysylphosphatidylglycerol synthetase-like protein (DUF2156 family)
MSDASSASESKFSFSSTLLAAIGGFAIFLIILLVAYMPNKVGAPGNGVKTPAERKAALAELRGKEQTLATTYGWVDKDKGVVRLPLDRAIELTIQEHAKK